MRVVSLILPVPVLASLSDLMALLRRPIWEPTLAPTSLAPVVLEPAGRPTVVAFDPREVMDAGNDVLLYLFPPSQPRVRGSDVATLRELYKYGEWAQRNDLRYQNTTISFCMRCPSLRNIYRNFDLSEEDLPMTILIPGGLTIGYHYRLPGELDADSVGRFTTAVRNGTRVPYIKSEETPVEQSTEVEHIVGSTFRSAVLDSKHDVLLFVAYGWLPETRMWLPGLERAAERLGALGTVRVATIDESANAMPTEFAEAWLQQGRSVGALALFRAGHKGDAPEFFDMDTLQDADAAPEVFSDLVLRWLAPLASPSFSMLPSGDLVSAVRADDL
mmetsp:Transcript_24400/g.59206  ORF Transcript_24400/g.59206 Transcript_24400/m.59206 type:complete len:331 (-) Transcript_24400:46-1038(-)